MQPPIAARRGVRDTMVRVLLATMLTPKMASAEDGSLTETLTYQERLELLINAPAEGMKEDTIVRVHEWPCILFAPNTERMAMVAGRQHCFRVWRCTFGVVFISSIVFFDDYFHCFACLPACSFQAYIAMGTMLGISLAIFILVMAKIGNRVF